MSNKLMGTTIDLNNLDIVFLIDRSGSMDTADTRSGRSRWEDCKEGAIAFANQLSKYDDDGIDLILFNDRIVELIGVQSSEIENAFKNNKPGSGTYLAPALSKALNMCINRFSNGKNQLIVVIGDGCPSDGHEVKKVIIDATKRMDRDEQMAILFVQIGKDPTATAYLQELDDDLENMGAKFDIVDSDTAENVFGNSLEYVVNKAFND